MEQTLLRDPVRMHSSRRFAGYERTYTEHPFTCVEVMGSGCLGISHDGDHLAGFTSTRVNFPDLQLCFLHGVKVLPFV